MARKLRVTVKPLAKIECIEQRSDAALIVSMHAPARNGEANARLVELLAEHFHKTKAHVRIVHGQRSRRKLIEVD